MYKQTMFHQFRRIEFMKIKLFNKFLCSFLCIVLTLSSVPLTALAEDALSDDIVVLYTNDVHSYIDSSLSYDVISAIKKDLQKEYKHVVLADAGDHIQGTAYGSMDKGESIIKLMNNAGYDVATLGNHEFDYNMQGCMNVIEWAEFPYTSCNFYNESNGVRAENVLDSYVMFECGDQKIAFVGITSPETFEKSTPKYFQDENGNFIYGISGGDDGKELQQDIQTAIDQATQAGATQVIALGHLGIDPSSTPWTSEETIAGVSGLDAFIDGHSHTSVEGKQVKDKNGNDVILTQTGEHFERIGMMVIDSESGDITTDFIECTGNEDDGYSLSSDLYSGTTIITDSTVKELKDNWLKDIDQKLGEKIGSASIVLDNYDSNGNRLVRMQETNSGDFVADALYYLFDNMELDVDLAIMNGGGIRNQAITGDITYKTCKDMHPFGNVACLQTVTGQQILDMLEWGARYAGEGEGGDFLQVSGISYKINTSIKNTTQADDTGVWIGGPTEEYRVFDVMVYNKDTDDWDELDLDAKYNLAGYNYTLRDLGGGFAMLSGSVNVLDYVMEDYMVIANYVKTFENGIIEAENSPLLDKYPDLRIDYSDISGNGRIDIVPELWVAGVKVTDENASDILGDGTTSYDFDSKTLTLNNANITKAYEHKTERVAGICADSDLNIELIGDNNKITAPDCARQSYGIKISGDLFISGTGTLVVNAGSVTSQDTDAESSGIAARGQLTIHKAKVIANGGSATVNGKGSAYSNGVYINNSLELDFNATLIANSGKTKATEAYSDAIEALGEDEDCINVSVFNGCLNAVGAEAIGEIYAGSSGVYISNGGFYLHETGANAFLTADNATVTADEEQKPYAYSNGIYVYVGDIGIKSGNFNVSSGNYFGADGDAYAIYLESGEGVDDNGATYTQGGYLNIECDEVTPDTNTPNLIGTTVTITSPNGSAICANGGIDIDEKLTISVPENGKVNSVEVPNDAEDSDQSNYWTVFDANGKEAQNITIKPLSYKVSIKGLSYDMAAKVPVGQSLNETYCKMYEVDDFSEILNTKKEGYIFGGWFTDENCTKGNEFDFSSPVTADTTIYAKWIVVQNDTVDKVEDTNATIETETPTDINTESSVIVDTDNPQTGVGNGIWIWIVLLVVSAGVILAITIKGKNQK